MDTNQVKTRRTTHYTSTELQRQGITPKILAWMVTSKRLHAEAPEGRALYERARTDRVIAELKTIPAGYAKYETVCKMLGISNGGKRDNDIKVYRLAGNARGRLCVTAFAPVAVMQERAKNRKAKGQPKAPCETPVQTSFDSLDIAAKITAQLVAVIDERIGSLRDRLEALESDLAPLRTVDRGE